MRRKLLERNVVLVPFAFASYDFSNSSGVPTTLICGCGYPAVRSSVKNRIFALFCPNLFVHRSAQRQILNKRDRKDHKGFAVGSLRRGMTSIPPLRPL